MDRSAPLQLIYGSLRPKGYQRESFAGRKAHPRDAARFAQLTDFVQNSMKLLGIPGAGLALIDHDKVVFQGGFGERELGKPERVDENTLFMAASNTKGMTTLLLAELVDQGELRWDEPVVEAYPPFKLGDADTTKKALVKNLICACTGLPRQDLEWLFEFKNATPESELALLGTMQPTSKFGEVFQYSNLMATAGGYIGSHIGYPSLELGAAYDKAMQTMVFNPLKMNVTTFDYARALASNHAAPHGDDVGGKPNVASMAFNYSIYPARPAGGVSTSSGDLIKYVQLEMDKGRLADGKQLVSTENFLMRRTPKVPLGEDATYENQTGGPDLRRYGRLGLARSTGKRGCYGGAGARHARYCHGCNLGWLPNLPFAIGHFRTPAREHMPPAHLLKTVRPNGIIRTCVGGTCSRSSEALRLLRCEA